MNEGKLSGSYVGGKGTKHTYRYEADYQLDGSALCYSARVWCDNKLQSQPRGTLDNVSPTENEAAIRRGIHSVIDRLTHTDAGNRSGRDAKTANRWRTL